MPQNSIKTPARQGFTFLIFVVQNATNIFALPFWAKKKHRKKNGNNHIL